MESESITTNILISCMCCMISSRSISISAQVLIWGWAEKLCSRTLQELVWSRANANFVFGLLGRAPEHMLMGQAHGHVLMGQAHEHMLRGPSQETGKPNWRWRVTKANLVRSANTGFPPNPRCTPSNRAGWWCYLEIFMS